MTVDERTVRVDLGGELDALNTGAFMTAFHQVLATSDAALIEFDVNRLTFLDSAGVQALIECQTAACARGRRLALRDPMPIVHQVLTITGLLDDLGLR
ncbi:STAS domain-containing protein [Actinoplanes sp. HUAS TT8]|uniref:STAS domain-containing protein n=1 Tax=Actinoplanes sp. HUAS TT8 TaxID=3447453 RepID=UPI003F51FFC5